jgi:hypothetical protein
MEAGILYLLYKYIIVPQRFFHDFQFVSRDKKKSFISSLKVLAFEKPLGLIPLLLDFLVLYASDIRKKIKKLTHMTEQVTHRNA